jgi:hypothetical protein
LRQRIEFAGLQAAGHDKVARTLRRALEQDRRLDLQKVAIREVFADEAHHAVAQRQVLRHARAADVEIAILEAQRLIHIVGRAADVKGRILGRVQDRHLVGVHFDVAGGQVRVAQTFGPRRDDTLHLNDIFAARLAGVGVGVGRLIRIDGDLGHAEAVAQIDEDQPAMVATPVHPAGQRHTFANMRKVKFATSMRLQHKTPFLVGRASGQNLPESGFMLPHSGRRVLKTRSTAHSTSSDCNLC